jgi:hypothetical protein
MSCHLEIISFAVGWCRETWGYLRSEFFKKLSARKEKRSGDGGGDDIYIKWPHFKALQFLIKYHKPRL